MNYKEFYTEIANAIPPQSNIDQLFSKILKNVFKSSNGVTGEKNIQEWIDEKLIIPLILDLKTGKMEAYDKSKATQTISLNSEYKNVENFIMNMKLFGIEHKFRYVLISPEMIVEYLFGNATQYNLPDWET